MNLLFVIETLILLDKKDIAFGPSELINHFRLKVGNNEVHLPISNHLNEKKLIKYIEHLKEDKNESL